MNEKPVHEMYRLAIIGLSTTGLLLDGYQLSDAVFSISIPLWLYMPECERATELVLNKVFDRGNQVSSISKH